MTHDPELVAIVRSELAIIIKGPISADYAARILDAINASGTHWVAPWRHTPEMERALSDIEEHWGELRDVYLTERDTTP